MEVVPNEKGSKKIWYLRHVSVKKKKVNKTEGTKNKRNCEKCIFFMIYLT